VDKSCRVYKSSPEIVRFHPGLDIGSALASTFHMSSLFPRSPLRLRITMVLVGSCGLLLVTLSLLPKLPDPLYELTDDPSAHRCRRIDRDGIVRVGTENQAVGQHPMLGLIRGGERKFVDKLRRQSRTTEETGGLKNGQYRLALLAETKTAICTGEARLNVLLV
jgi:hypothetical protein